MAEELSSRDALIAAALAGGLTEGEHRRFAAMYEADAEVRKEFDGARALMERMDRAGLSWSEQEVPAGLAGRIERATSDRSAAPGPPAAPDHGDRPDEVRRARERRVRRRFSALTLGAAAASALLVGGVAGAGIAQFSDATADGPPGTLGAVEPVAFTDVAEGTTFTGSVVAHTWGTETMLEVDGLRVGEAFEVVLTKDDGEELLSGTFLGSEKTVTCSMNAAVLREDVAEVEIRDEAGLVVATTALPRV